MKKETARIIFEGGKNADMLMAIADIIGKEIIIHRAGENSAADVVKCGDSRYILNPRISEGEDQIAGPWEINYQVADDGQVLWVFIGHKLLGPCYQGGSDGKWCNCYSHGNFGKNCASGGNWSSGPRNMRHYDTLQECIKGRMVEIEWAKKSDNTSDRIFLHYAAVPAIEPALI